MEFKESERIVLIHFGELWLRGKNRGTYIKALAKNINAIMDGEDVRLEKLYDRFILRLGKRSDVEMVKEKLRHVFGISNFEVAYIAKSDMKSIVKLSTSLLKHMDRKKVLKINASRSYKGTKFNSVEINEKVLKVAKKLRFDLSNKDFESELRINVTKDATFISWEKIKAFGGLPVGTSGKSVILISGGIDSPVAAWYAMKRGVEPVYVHIHGYGNAEEAANSKMRNILEELAKYSPHSRVYYIPSHIFQVAALRSGRYELVLLKAFMFLVADRIAKAENAELIFTGESLGQVASQTASNLGAEQDGVKTPVLRPLVGFDKEEIIKVARAIRTYDYSVMPYKDVCSINSKNPKTHTRLEKIKELKKGLSLSKIVDRSIKSAEVMEVG